MSDLELNNQIDDLIKLVKKFKKDRTTKGFERTIIENNAPRIKGMISSSNDINTLAKIGYIFQVLHTLRRDDPLDRPFVELADLYNTKMAVFNEILMETIQKEKDESKKQRKEQKEQKALQGLTGMDRDIKQLELDIKKATTLNDLRNIRPLLKSVAEAIETSDDNVLNKKALKVAKAFNTKQKQFTQK